MRIQTLFEAKEELVPGEIEVMLFPGLPKINFVGLPDQNIKESAFRIKAAIVASGFNYPRGKQILVNLKSNQTKQISRGLELAVAVAILQQTEQMQEHPILDGYYYAELSLNGEIQFPRSQGFKSLPQEMILITGPNCNRSELNRYSCNNLRELVLGEGTLYSARSRQAVRPEIGQVSFSRQMAEVLKVVSYGAFHTLLAGPPGSGKSFFADLVWRLREEPPLNQLGPLESWLGLLKPHHSSTTQGLLGGAQGKSGDLIQASGGVLILDELFEFKPKVLESLREPMETGRLRVSRAQRNTEEQFQTQVIATTNLCPCGDYIPGVIKYCRFSLARCRSHAERISGPFLDRFQILAFSHTWGRSSEVSLSDLLVELQECRSYQQRDLHWQPPGTRSHGLQLEDLKSVVAQEFVQAMAPSHRRRRALLNVAWALAELRFQPLPELQDLQTAYELVILPFEKLKRWD